MGAKRRRCLKSGCNKFTLQDSPWFFCRKHDDEKIRAMRRDEQLILSEKRRVPLAQEIYVGILATRDTWALSNDEETLEAFGEECKDLVRRAFVAADVFNDHAEKRSS
jgi:hypothetical protein